MSSDAPTVCLERFEKRYGSIQAVHALDLEIAAGESFALLGPNGSGKTTIIRAVVGLHAPTAGRVLIDGIDVTRSPDRVKDRLSYVPQRVTMPDLLTAREVVRTFAKLKNAPMRRVDEVLELFALTDDADRPTRELSGGMLQRVGLAVAFLKRVSLFVLDEPTVNLDLPGVRRLQELLGELKTAGVTVLFSTHLMQSALRLADRVAILVEGRLVNIEAAPVFRSEVSSQTTVRVLLGSATDGVVEAARGAGAEVADRNGRQVLFRAHPERHLGIIRAIEQAGGTIEEFHAEPPDWEAFIKSHFGEEKTS